jgi:hypothetical protein
MPIKTHDTPSMDIAALCPSYGCSTGSRQECRSYRVATIVDRGLEAAPTGLCLCDAW